MTKPSLNCPIAIVGLACRYPDANTPAELFENSLAQRRSFRQIPDGRLAASSYFDPTGKAKDRTYAHQAAVLKNFKFDRTWFQVSQRSFEVTDLTHWLALMVAKDALDDIRFYKNGKHPSNEAVRVVIGNTLTGEFSRANLMRLRWPYVRRVVTQQLLHDTPDMDEAELARVLREIEGRYKRPFPNPNEDFLAGGLANTIAGRICNHFDFKGGGYTVDGACSSSLLAVTDACTALMCGDADMVLAGGVDLSLDPFELVGFSRTAALAKQEMRVYDKRSQGFWPGEGCGFMVLMRYEDALEQCKHIYAVIKGWGVSSDGRGGLTRPESSGQMLALERCYKKAGYGIESVGYFEGHGTGTRVGDQVELSALLTARQRNGESINPAVISSIKANIGHTKAAAGLASLIRATMCLHQNVLPPTTACQQPHELLDEHPHNLMTLAQLRPWTSGHGARRAGVSAMGFGGINTHIALEEAPPPKEDVVLYPNGFDYSKLKVAYQDAELFLLFGQRRKDILWTIDHLASFTKACSRAELTDLAIELGDRATFKRRTFWKAAIVAHTPVELNQKLQIVKEFLPEEGDERTVLLVEEGIYISHGNTKGKIGFIFSGQGSPVRDHGGIHATRFEEVAHVYETSGLEHYDSQDDTDFAQPAITTASIAGLRVLQERLGIEADVSIGHSLGELSALHWAGYFDEATLLNIAKLRGRVMADNPQSSGAMAAVKANRAETAKAIGHQSDVFIANINSPQQTVISGDREKIRVVVETLQQKGFMATMLNVRQAFHTPAMAAISDTFKGRLASIHTDQASNKKVISTVTGKPLAADLDVVDYLSGQLAAPVQFLEAIRHAEQEVDLFIEVGPGQLMTNLTRSFCERPMVALDMGGESIVPLLHTTGAAYVLHCASGIRDFFMDRFRRRFDWHWSNTRFIENPCEAIPDGPESEMVFELESQEDEEDQSVDIADASVSTIERLRRVISEHTGLPTWAFEDNSRMLSELHLNSITVGEIVAKMTAASGLSIPVDMTAYANSSVAEIAIALDDLQKADVKGQTNQPKVPAGVDTWIRYFTQGRQRAEQPKSSSMLSPGVWEAFGKMTPTEESLLQKLNTQSHGDGVIVWLGTELTNIEIHALLTAAKHCIERVHKSESPLNFVVVQDSRGVSGFVKSFFLENPAIRTLILNIARETYHKAPTLVLSEIDAETPPFCELFIDGHGQRQVSALQKVPRLPVKGDSIITDDDVVLITGGGKGISAECGYQLALKSGCGLLIIGRSLAKENQELAANLARFRQSNVRFSYQIADVSELKELKAAIQKGCADLGAPITAIVHGAGINAPRQVENLTMAHINATLYPKTVGFEHLNRFG